MRLRIGLFIILLSLVFARCAFAQGSQVKVLVLPFDTHSNVDISATRRNIMDSIAGPLHSKGADIAGIDVIRDLMLKKGVTRFDEAAALEIAKTVPADFAVLGSITKIGRTVDVDWRIFDLKSAGTVSFYFKSAASEPDLIGRINEAGAQAYDKMLSVLKTRPALKTGNIDKILISGNRRVDAEAVMRKIKSKVGELFSPDDVKEDIRAVYATGYFDDVSADLSDTASGKVLTFFVKEMPFIKKVELQGNKEIKEDKIKGVLTIKENTVLDRVILGDNAEKIKGLYAEEGYYNASVKPAIESDGLEAKIIFKIDEGPEVKVKRITVIGNKFFTDKKIKKMMNTNEVGFFTILTKSGKFNEFMFQNDLAIILGSYFDNGFVHADIIDHRVLLSQDKKWFYITIAVSEGGQYKVGAIDVNGDILGTKEDLLEKLKVKSGEIFSRSRLSKGIDAITDVYGDKGYAYADIKPVTKIDEEKKTVDLTVEIKKNEMVYIENIDITGNVRTRDKVIRRELELGEGDLFNSSELKRSRNNLRRLGYFDDVKIAQTQGSASDKMKLDVDVKERPTGTISLGFGYSSVDKLIGTASVSQANFMGTGIKLDLSGTISATSSRYVLGVTEPWLFDKPISAGVDIYDSSRDYTSFSDHRKGFDVRLGTRVYDRYTNGFLTYKLENVNISNVAGTASQFIQAQAGRSMESSVTVSLRRDTRDDAFFPTDGSVEIVSAQVAGGPLGGTDYFLKYEANAIKYFALPWDTTFSIHGNFGYLQGFEGKPAPIFERYFLGGIDTIRGFSVRSLGPKDPVTGDVIGGQTMAVANAEFMFPLIPEQRIKGVLFFDAGNAYNKGYNLSDLRKGAGIGVRWFSPVGPLRLELGFNLDKRAGEKAEQWEFSIGSGF